MGNMARSAVILLGIGILHSVVQAQTVADFLRFPFTSQLEAAPRGIASRG